MDEVTMAHPLDLLDGVGELWHVIATKLGPRDLYNLSDAHPYWSALLQRRRPNFLIQLCLPLLTDRVLDLPDLLHLRLVSKACKQSVDHILQHKMHEEVPFISEKERTRTDFDMFAWDMENVIANQRMEVLVVDRLSPFERNQTGRVSAWLDSIELTPSPSANPILSREAIFRVKDFRGQTEELQKETTDLVTRCLRAHGRQLLRCTFEVNLGLNGVRSFEREYSQFRDWLNLVPNLISLNVDFFRYTHRHNEADLAAHIQVNSLPELPNLSKLKVDGLPPALLQALVQKYRQVQTLELGIAGHEESRLDPVQLEYLNTLKLEIIGAHGLVSLQQLRTESWLVGLHTLEIYVYRGGNNVTWGVLIDFLNSNFGAAGRLIKVGLLMPTLPYSLEGDAIFKDSRDCRLRLPQVEQIRLVAHNLFLLEFLLPMRHTLKKLAILNHHEEVMEECKQLVEWNGWLGERLLTSNVWEAFPRLSFLRAQINNSRGWTYRRTEGGAVIDIHSYGVEEEIVPPEETIDYWDEVANRNGNAGNH